MDTSFLTAPTQGLQRRHLPAHSTDANVHGGRVRDDRRLRGLADREHPAQVRAGWPPPASRWACVARTGPPWGYTTRLFRENIPLFWLLFPLFQKFITVNRGMEVTELVYVVLLRRKKMMLIKKISLNDILGVTFFQKPLKMHLFIPPNFFSWKTPWFWEENIRNSWRCSKMS
jgi:hypothetical protein